MRFWRATLKGGLSMLINKLILKGYISDKDQFKYQGISEEFLEEILEFKFGDS